ncbi:MAG TPA: CBS domain-containing protein [Herpetosiphonaceae bacterium]|nr:CBS domain-containing protein [Herpetosiphonaceae bacterium]
MTAQISVGEIMNGNVIACPAETGLREAIEQLQEHRIHALVVVDGPGFLAGVFSQTDALRAWSEGRDYDRAMERPVADFMTRDVVTCMAHVDVGRAAKLLTQHKIHRLVVVEERNDGRVWPIGVLSQTDIVRKMGEIGG